VPTYEYACRGCDQHLEVVQSFKDDALTECPSCQGQLRKVYSAAGLIFKGSGWHAKDYAVSAKGSGTSSSAGSDSSSSDSSSSDRAGAATSSSSDSTSSGSSSDGASSSSSSASSSSSSEKKSA
jgi:putative FmdB family regulatory protein